MKASHRLLLSKLILNIRHHHLIAHSPQEFLKIHRKHFDGMFLGRAKAVQGVLHFAKPKESIVIAKIKGSDLKIAIK